MQATYIQDPDALLDYVIDWSEWLPSGDTIDTSTWFVDDDALEIESTSKTDTTATVRVSGGTLNRRYKVTNRITTTAGLINDQTITIRIREK